MATEDDSTGGWLVSGKFLNDTKITGRSLLKLVRKKIASVSNKNIVAGEEKREWSGVFESLLAKCATVFLGKFMKSCRVKEVSSYSVCTF